jgi:PAS domain-containing protein
MHMGEQYCFGFYGDAIIGSNVDAYFVDFQSTKNILEGIFRTEETGLCEQLAPCKNGELHLLAWRCHVLKDYKGIITGMLASARDITDERRAEDALRTSQLQLSNAMDLANIVYWEFDPVTQTYVFNDPFYAFYGTTAEQEGGYLVPRSDYAKRFIHPDDVPLYNQFVKENTAKPVPELFADTEQYYPSQWRGRYVHTVRVIRDDLVIS